ncbi:hypothetical protein PV797_02075 [Clostridiaceae bacterium M8S5]|nr:hypothetical protein PV797_02075 [Clostridiaceae bacterium M8S5]
MQKYIEENKVFWLDPRTKIMLLIFINIIVFKGKGIWTELTIFAFICVLFGLSHKFKSMIIFSCIYASIFIIDNISQYLPRIVGSLCSMTSTMIHLYIPFLMMGSFLISTTRINELVAMMERLHIATLYYNPVFCVISFFSNSTN